MSELGCVVGWVMNANMWLKSIFEQACLYTLKSLLAHIVQKAESVAYTIATKLKLCKGTSAFGVNGLCFLCFFYLLCECSQLTHYSQVQLIMSQTTALITHFPVHRSREGSVARSVAIQPA